MMNSEESAIKPHKLVYSAHAKTRMAQRGFRDQVPEFIIEHGTKVRDGYLLRKKDVETIVYEPRRWPFDPQKLVGARVVLKENYLVTIYRASSKTDRNLFRQHRH